MEQKHFNNIVKLIEQNKMCAAVRYIQSLTQLRLPYAACLLGRIIRCRKDNAKNIKWFKKAA